MLIVLIALTAFFVATEFAIVKVRESRIDYLIAVGNRRAKSVKTVITNLDEYLSACQLGITATALGIGWLGKPALKQTFDQLFTSLKVPVQSVDFFSCNSSVHVHYFLPCGDWRIGTKDICNSKGRAN